MDWQSRWRNIEVRGVVHADVPALRAAFPDVSLRHIRYRLESGRPDDIGRPLTCPVELDGRVHASQSAAARFHKCKPYVVQRYLDQAEGITFAEYLARLRRWRAARGGK